MYTKILIAAALVIATSGCASTKRSSIAFQKDSGGSLSVWDADMSAAIAYGSGKMCMQRALAIKNIDANATAKLSEAVLDLAKAVQSAAAGGRSGELASLTGTIKQTASILTTSTERTAFLDYGMFYICQISANGSISSQETSNLIELLIAASAQITN